MTPAQLAEARRIYAFAVQHGVPPMRAQELVTVALHESGLDPHAKGVPVAQYGGRRARGDLQLLSGGYVQRAQRLGGIETTQGNVGAILPDYLNFWRKNPRAPVGLAGARVEASGKGADWYARDFDAFNFLRDGQGGSSAPDGGGQMLSAAAGPDMKRARAQFAMALINNVGQHGHPDFATLTEAVKGLHQAKTAAPPSTVDEFQPDAGAIVRGGYAFPVAGPSNFTNDWGAPRADTGHHEGTDIFAKRGTPVVAIQDGVVTKMGPSAIGGNRLWINGKFYYAHLDGYAPGVKPGVRVRRGQVLGFVGDTGDARGTPTHLHFGWSPNASQGASWANPFPLLHGIHG